MVVVFLWFLVSFRAVQAYPRRDVSPAVGAVSCADEGTISAQAEGMGGACCDCDDVVPALDIALPVAVIPNGQNPAGSGHAHCVATPGGHRDDLLPPADVARSCGRCRSSEYSPVVSQPDRVEVTCRNRREVPPVPNSALPSSVVTDRYG
ncbi:hypothetical protein GCM10009824_24460 [Kocuria atrinae]|uniref:Secreted protein n=1 Tax=Kocuria atrinae TaxID=592377 RepID=A0ABN2Y5V5_9MICC